MSVLILPPLRDDGQKVPCEVGDSSVFSPQYVVYRRMLDETILYMSPVTRGATHDIDKAKKYPSKGSAQQACRAFGGSCHVLELRPQSVQLAQAQAGRKLPPVVTGDAAQDADYVRVRAAREAGCTRPCGNQPNLPVCTKCFVNLHAGKWTADEANGNFVFGHGVGWEKVLTICSQVHGWIKPSGIN